MFKRYAKGIWILREQSFSPVIFSLRIKNETNGKTVTENETSKDNSLKNDAGHGLFNREFSHVLLFLSTKSYEIFLLTILNVQCTHCKLKENWDIL